MAGMNGRERRTEVFRSRNFFLHAYGLRPLGVFYANIKQARMKHGQLNRARSIIGILLVSFHSSQAIRRPPAGQSCGRVAPGFPGWFLKVIEYRAAFPGARQPRIRRRVGVDAALR